MSVPSQYSLQKSSLAVFILAHPDDDVFVRPLIRRAIASGKICQIFILTSSTDHLKRKAEIEAACADFGSSCELIFLGEELSIRDGVALDHLMDIYQAILAHLADDPSRLASEVYTHAWEFGHPDHDAAHLVAGAIARHLSIAEQSRSVTFYRAKDGPLPLSVQSPHFERNANTRLRLTLRERFDLLMAVRFYPSQWKTFIGLWPFMLLKSGFAGRIHTAPLSESAAPDIPDHIKPAQTLSDTRFNISPLKAQKQAIDFFYAISD